ncbi:hypothetical protein FD755_017450 [Muntiacus reevesi]|uniref:G-protein coupled receptors family 1 profile domain-containing protein n=1 Tax=Muntiacus reevesi TaxID=9886 RepID=A0A5N3XA28_MUNRE|nr:hypothetical protein FD755_017450 [Muntiacus reevesi]
MHEGNQTSISELLLWGLFSQPGQQELLFALFLAMYLVTVVGNALIVLPIGLDSYLHTPMYLFLANLSLADISSISTSIPKMLMNIQTKSRSISYESCITQMYFSIVFVVTDNFLLGVMACDRFVAICHPLNYTTLRLAFCDGSALPHFFCDLAPLLRLSCSDTAVHELVLSVMGSSVVTLPFALILVSYACIARAVLRLSRPEGRWKAFSTCGSHLTVVFLFYGTIVGVYFFPSSPDPDNRDKVGALLFTVVTPMTNPFIYSLRSTDVRGALRRLLLGKRVLPVMP